ncbi:MAG: hypothetical protein U1F17_12280 [Burkholderiaceae bacterium]
MCAAVPDKTCRSHGGIGAAEHFGASSVAPAIRPAVRVDRRRRDDHPAVAAQVEPFAKARLVRDGLAEVPEVQVSPASAGQALERRLEPRETSLERGQARIAAVPGVDVEHQQARDGAGDDTDVGVGPAPEPLLDLVGRRAPTLVRRPAHQRPLAARLHRRHRPAERQVTQRCRLRIRIDRCVCHESIVDDRARSRHAR